MMNLSSYVRHGDILWFKLQMSLVHSLKNTTWRLLQLILLKCLLSVADKEHFGEGRAETRWSPHGFLWSRGLLFLTYFSGSTNRCPLPLNFAIELFYDEKAFLQRMHPLPRGATSWIFEAIFDKISGSAPPPTGESCDPSSTVLIGSLPTRVRLFMDRVPFTVRFVNSDQVPNYKKPLEPLEP